MLTTWDKAIAAFVTAIVSTLALLQVNVTWLTPELQAALVAGLTALVTYVVPNKPAA